MFKLYCLTTTNGRVFYIGITKQDLKRRKYQHTSVSKRKDKSGDWTHKYRSCNKIRSLNFQFDIILLLNLPSWKAACVVEKQYIAWSKKMGFQLTNHTKGGNNCKPYRATSEETREKLRKANLGPNNPMWGHIPSKESRERQSHIMKGRVPEHYKDPVRKAKAIAKMKQNLPDRNGKNNANWGNRGKRSRLSKTLLQLDLEGNTVATYQGLHEAARQLGFNERCIRRVITGERKKYKGFKWRYA